jgi:hypothetical protein
MSTRLLNNRLVVVPFVLALIVAACGSDGSPVTLRYITPGGPDNCYLSAFDGELVMDPTAGLVFAVHNGQRWPVLWPKGWTARHAGSEIEVLYPGGTVYARTNTPISPEGGLDAAGNWDMCGFEPITK